MDGPSAASGLAARGQYTLDAEFLETRKEQCELAAFYRKEAEAYKQSSKCSPRLTWWDGTLSARSRMRTTLLCMRR